MEKLLKKLRIWIPVIGIVAVAGMAIWVSCKDELLDKNFLTSEDVSIYDYIVEKDPSMSMFLEIADKVKFGGTLGSYFKYTCFIPTNEGISKYLSEALGKSSVDALTEDECFTILKYHTISMPAGVDSLTSLSFVDGRLSIPNMMAKYLTIRTVPDNGKIAYEVNRQAKIVEVDIRTSNGYIQKIDNVLIPPVLTVGKQIEALPDKFSIFREVMKKTYWTDSLNRNKDNGIWWTVFVQSNETLASMGITSENDLLETLRDARKDIGGDDARNPFTMTKEDSLFWTYSAYQVVRSLNYVVDLTRTPSLLTCAPNQAMTFQVKKDVIVVDEYNDPVTGAVREPGVPIDRQSDWTDLSCYNGVLIELGKNPARDTYIGPMQRKPQAVYWDVCTQPEWRNHPSYMQSNIPHIDTRNMSEMWFYNAQDEEIDAGNWNYIYNTAQTDNKWQVVNHDYVRYRVRDFSYMEFKMPLLIEGEYKLWTCVRRDGDPIQVRLQFYVLEENPANPEEKMVQKLRDKDLYFQYGDKVKNEADMINLGVKRYVARARVNESFALDCGTFEIKNTGRHILRIEVVNQGTKSADSFLDMFHFIPVDDDQYWPRFDRAGKAVWPDTPCNEIYPYENDGCNMANY